MRSGPLTVTLSLPCFFNHLTMASNTSLVSCFHSRFFLVPFCSNALIIVYLFYQIIRIVEFQTRCRSVCIFTFIIRHITLTFPSTLKTLPIFVTVAMLSRCQSPAKCRIRNIDDSCRQKVNYRYYCNFPRLEFMQLPERPEDVPSQGRRNSRIIKFAYILEICILKHNWQYLYTEDRCSCLCRTRKWEKIISVLLRN